MTLESIERGSELCQPVARILEQRMIERKPNQELVNLFSGGIAGAFASLSTADGWIDEEVRDAAAGRAALVLMNQPVLVDLEDASRRLGVVQLAPENG